MIAVLSRGSQSSVSFAIDNRIQVSILLSMLLPVHMVVE